MGAVRAAYASGVVFLEAVAAAKSTRHLRVGRPCGPIGSTAAPS